MWPVSVGGASAENLAPGHPPRAPPSCPCRRCRWVLPPPAGDRARDVDAARTNGVDDVGGDQRSVEEGSFGVYPSLRLAVAGVAAGAFTVVGALALRAL